MIYKQTKAQKPLQLRDKNQITLPSECIPSGVKQFAYEIKDDGTTLLIPMSQVPASQLYFWTRRWQEGEKRTDEDIKAGRVTEYKNIDSMTTEMKSRRRKSHSNRSH